MAVKLVVLLVMLVCTVHCVPKSGIIPVEINLLSTPTKQNDDSTIKECFNIGLFTGSLITISGNAIVDPGSSVILKVNVFRARCANLPSIDCGVCPPSDNPVDPYYPIATNTLENPGVGFKFLGSKSLYVGNTTLNICKNFKITDVVTKDQQDASTTALPDSGQTTPIVIEQQETTLEPQGNITDAPPTNASTTEALPLPVVNAAGRKRSAERQKKAEPVPSLASKATMQITTEGGVYVIQIIGQLNRNDDADKTKNLTANLTISLEVLNPHGYLSAVDFPALVFFGIMTGVYAIYAIAWLITLGLNFTDLVRLQFWVLGVVLLGFLEKALFLAEYDQTNQGKEIHYLIILAVAVSALKRALSRMLLVIVALGYGIVKPRLGDSLTKVIGAGVIYWLLATINGILRARNETAVSNDTSVLLSYGLLILVDIGIMFWIFSATVETRRALRIRKNYVKLSSYNHFAYTLIFSIVAALGFIVWDLFAHIYPANGCLRDWGEVWLHDCFWHVLFAIILAIIMIIWRPGVNNKRFAYSLVDDEEGDDHIEQGRNKNFDTVKMRQVGGSTSEPQPPSTQAEDDLRWVEENLPTSAIDKALPLILDSDEELMTTRFETSKMN